MRLEYLENFGGDPILVTEDASPEDALRVFREMSWEFLGFISLTADSGEYLEVSGSKYDGMSLRLMRSQEEYLSKHPPTTDEIEYHMTEYIKQGGSYLPDIEYVDFTAQPQHRPLVNLSTLWNSGCLTVLVLAAALALFWLFD